MKSQKHQKINTQKIELTLRIDPAYVDQLLNHPLLKKNAKVKPRQEQISSTYFDTSDFSLKCHGAFLRLGQSKNGCVQTLKTVDTDLSLRSALEWSVTGPSLDINALRSLTRLNKNLAKLVRDAQTLVPIFSMEFSRTIWDLQLASKDEIEFTLDQGEIVHENVKVPISEIEMSLKVGDPKILFDCALLLLDSMPMHIENRSKSDRGYALCMPKQAPQVVKADRLKLDKHMTVEQGFITIVTDCIRQMQGNELAVGQSCDSDGLHQMRVGLRRLQSALRLFKNVAPLPDNLRGEFDWLSSQLGPARDWEVLSGSTLTFVASAAPENSGIPLLQCAAADIVLEKRKQASTAVQSTRYAHLMLAFLGWLKGAVWRDTIAKSEREKLEAPLPRFADKTLARDQHRLLQRAKHLDGADPNLRHQLRIAAKKTRYATEFFQSFYHQKRVSGYIGSLTALQDELGWSNDVTVADSLLHGLVENRQELTGGIGFVCGYLKSDLEHQDRRLRKLWKRFESVALPIQK